MSVKTKELLEAFEALADSDKRDFTAAFLRLVAPFDSGPIEDSEIAAVSDQLLASLP